MSKNPNRCDDCKEMKGWLANPEGFSSMPIANERNSDIAKLAAKICPGLSIAVKENVQPGDVAFREDGSAVVAPGVVKQHCEFYEIVAQGM